MMKNNNNRSKSHSPLLLRQATLWAERRRAIGTRLPLLVFALAAAVLQGCKEGETARKAEPVKVVTQTVAALSANGLQQFSGTVEEESGSALSFATAGTVSRVLVAEGQTVKAGQLIAEVDPQSARNAHEATLAARQQAEDAYARMKQLHDAGSLSEIKWIEVQSKLKQAVSAEQISKKSLGDCKLYAAVGGYVSEKPVEVGQNVIPGMTVAKVVRIDRVKVKMSVPEEEIASVKVGQTVAVTVAALGNRRFAGRVVEKGVEANPLSRSYDVKVLVQNPSHELLPGMVCDASIAGGHSEPSAIMLPARIVQIDIDNRPFVWTAVDGKAQKTYVGIGASVGSNVTVTNGLSAGDKVIVRGQQKVSQGTRVSVK